MYAIYTCVTATKQTHNISLLSDSERKCSVEILGAPRVRAGLTYYYLMICKTERGIALLASIGKCYFKDSVRLTLDGSILHHSSPDFLAGWDSESFLALVVSVAKAPKD